MVGPRAGEWKVLRETDGERFVGQKKVAVFQEILRTIEMKIFVT